MKAIKLLLFSASLFFAAVNSNAQTVDEIINKNIEAMGGKDKLTALKTVKMTGSMSVQGTDISITMTKSHLVGMRLDMEIMGTSNYQIINAKQGWVFMPVMGMTEAKEMDAEQYKSFSSQMDIQGTLFNYKEKGSTIELAGTEKVDGAEAYKLKVTLQSGKTVNYFIDKKTDRVIKTSSKTTVQDQEMDVETAFSDYKQNIDGYWFPYTISNMQGPITFDKVETNITVDEKIYTN
jgi:hypothetical protein